MKFKAKILMLMVALMVECDSPRLEIPTDDLIEDKYFLSIDQFEKAVRGVYSGLTDLHGAYQHQNNLPHQIRLLPADDVTHYGSKRSDDQHYFESFGEVDGLNIAMNRLYKSIYSIINRANIVIDHLEHADEIIFESQPELINHQFGEMLFLRALMNYKIFNYWGGNAPLMDERIKSVDDMMLDMSGGTLLLDRCIEDLQHAVALLPSQWDASNNGRATRNSACGLLMRALMCRGCYAQNHNDYQEALEVFGKIEGRILMADFGANFDPQQENNAESLFEFQASAPPSLMNNIWLSNESGAATQNMAAYWGMFNRFPGYYFSYPYMPTKKLIEAFHKDDPRFEEIFIQDSVRSLTGYLFVKYLKRKPQEHVNPQSEWINNPRIIRYADVILLNAEALLKTGKKREAIQAVNQVRSRARNMVPGGVEPADFPEGETDAKLIMQWIMDERFRELCAEGATRWFDLKRWHHAGDIKLGEWTEEDFSTIVDDFAFDIQKHLLWPLPSGDVQKNPKLQQNPGY